MKPEIIDIQRMRIVGISREMSLANNHTQQLWQEFMRRKGEIKPEMPEMVSLQLYGPNYFEPFDPSNTFIKWAAVASNSTVPDGMQAMEIPEGKYAKFKYIGNPAGAAGFFYSIFTVWLPAMGLRVDDRPHFELLGQRYTGADDSEEDIFIPIKNV